MLRTKEEYHEDLFKMKPNISLAGKQSGLETS
jgi:hypothetical protein